MEKIQLISNNGSANHLNYIIKYLEMADEVWIATAFLKTSGLELIVPTLEKHIKASKPITIIAGQNFGLTEPSALRVLHGLFSKKVNANQYLNKAKNKQSVFHPKLFMFKQGNTGIIISGSANITNGGLRQNEEFSICLELPISSPQWKEALNYYNGLIITENADQVSLLIINRYEQYYNEQKKAREKQKAAPNKKTSEYSFDLVKLKDRINDYRDTNYLKNLNKRIRDYQSASLLLNEIADNNKLSQRRFEDIIDLLVGKKGTKGLWRSGSLLRLRFDVYKYKKEFRDLVMFIKDSQNQPATKVFDQARILVDNIKGAKINYVTEIMMTYQPKRFANLNNNPIKVLKEEAGVYFKSTSRSFNGEDYQSYCSVITEISNSLELKNMLEVDSFFNTIYWKLKKEGKLN